MLLLDMHLLSAHRVCRFLSNCFRNMWSHLLPQQGVFFHYLKIVVYMNWDKHLVGRSFISWPFQFEFYYFCCLPGEGKNILSPRQMNHQITAPLQLAASAWNINCLMVTMAPEGRRREYLEILKPVSLRRCHSEMSTNSILTLSPSGVGVEEVVGSGGGGGGGKRERANI